NGDVESSVPQGVEVWLVFGEGSVTGKTGCNQLGGTGQNYRADATTITFDDIVTTQMACGDPYDEVEAAVLGVLRGEVEYQIDRNVLTLRHPSGAGLRLRAE